MKLNIEKIYSFVSAKEVENYSLDAKIANVALRKKQGKGSDFMGWVNLPSSITDSEFSDIEATVNSLKNKVEIVVIIGIGGSYLGAKAVIDALSDNFAQLKGNKNAPLVLFAGQNISEDYMFELRELLKTKEYALVVISKSGTTTEPALAFRFLKHDIEQKYGKEEARNRIIAITDASKGALRTLATQEGYKTYVIPDDVGGRFSVLTPVGLVPIAFAGFDIRKLVAGAVNMENKTAPDVQFDQNIAEIYAAARNALYNRGKYIEILVNYNPKLHFVAEWWKQLYGESEGKEKKGIFPASVDFSSDLHSMGQYIQEGIRVLFETVISVENVNATQVIELENNDLDGLNYLAGKRIDHVNKMAELGTQIAHIQGGVPNIKIEIESINEFALGELLYFFEKACGISGAILDVNPFDQPGVEAYKKNMFALLGKKGYEHLLKNVKLK